jgi:hypothetical protein
MGLTSRLAYSIGGLALLILLTALARHRGLIGRGSAGTFAWLVTHVTLPALIFSSLAGGSLAPHRLDLAASMLAAELACLLLAWLAAGLLRLGRKRKGSFMLVSAFGSSALLGYALVTQVFPGSDTAMSDAVIISEIGVAPTLFVAGVWIAMWYGRDTAGAGGAGRASIRFLYSPVFVSLVLGIAFSAVRLPDSQAVAALTALLRTVGSANTLLVAITVGLLLEFEGLGDMLAVSAVSSGIKLVAQPLVALSVIAVLGVSAMGRNVLLLQTAMPAATLAVVFSHQYGCDSRAASFMLLVSTVLSAVTVPVLFSVLG